PALHQWPPYRFSFSALCHPLCLLFFFFFYYYGAHLNLHSFPTRRSSDLVARDDGGALRSRAFRHRAAAAFAPRASRGARRGARRSEEHTSELQSRGHLVCRLLLEKKKTPKDDTEYK